MIEPVESTGSQPPRVVGADSFETPGWRLEDIDFSAIEPSQTRASDVRVFMLVASSFIESGTRLYASNLADHFRDDHEVSHWLANGWEAEELQHGRALRAYVAGAWPSFDWSRACAGFMRDYRPLCASGKLEARRGLELAARCVVETGTTALYRAIGHRTHDPVMRTLLAHISHDEMGHYKQFFRHFRRYQQEDRSSRVAVLGALIRRSAEISREDTDLGLRCAYSERCLSNSRSHITFDDLRSDVRGLLRADVPFGLAGTMWLRPIQLPARTERQAGRFFSVLARSGMACLA